MRAKDIFSGLLVLFGIGLLITACSAFGQATWSDEEVAKLRSLWIGSLPPLPVDPSNQYADDSGAAALGQNFSLTRALARTAKLPVQLVIYPKNFFRMEHPSPMALAQPTAAQ